MLVKPNTALTGVPSGRVIGGSAWKARKMNPEPSISTRCMGASSEELMSAVASSFIQDVDARAIRTHHLSILDIQEHPRMAEGTSVAGDGSVVDMKGFRGKSCAVRHLDPQY